MSTTVAARVLGSIPPSYPAFCRPPSRGEGLQLLHHRPWLDSTNVCIRGFIPLTVSTTACKFLYALPGSRAPFRETLDKWNRKAAVKATVADVPDRSVCVIPVCYGLQSTARACGVGPGRTDRLGAHLSPGAPQSLDANGRLPLFISDAQVVATAPTPLASLEANGSRHPTVLGVFCLYRRPFVVRRTPTSVRRLPELK